jgi:serine-type D-Ala-D-Ala endopeptidase (penicillin-binding protein 7)
VRQNQPLLAIRLCTVLLGLIVCIPVPVNASQSAPERAAAAKAAARQSAAKPAARKTSAKKPVVKKKPAYSKSSAAARKARLARARAAARAREQARVQAALKIAMTPRFKTDENGALVPDVRAAAAIIFDPQTGQVLWEENGQAKRSIASITKVMTAIVFLEDNPDLSRVVTIQRSDVYAASTTYLRANERLSLDNLLHLALIASDNAAARALARVSHGGTAAFIERMNEKALELGLLSTTFADPSGLNPANVSSAYDISRLISYAATDETTAPIIAPIMQTTSYTVSTNRRKVKINNTNRLMAAGLDVIGGKTGFISKAGYCLATLLRLPQGKEVAVVVLGATSGQGRVWETRHLFNWLTDKAGDLFGQDSQQ